MMPSWTRTLGLALALALPLLGMCQSPALWSAVQARNDSLQARQYLYSHHAHLRWSWNPVKFGFRTALFVYQSKITYQIPSSCMYTPSCSEFGRQCFEQYGPLKALFLSMDRVSRCSPLMVSKQSRYDIVKGEFSTRYADPASRYQFRARR